MARETPPDRIAEHTKADGSILRARIEWRKADGVWGIDLRAFGRGRPRLASPDAGLTERDVATARKLAITELKAMGDGKLVATAAVVQLPMDQVETYLRSRVTSKEMTKHTAAVAWTCIDRCWTILVELFGLTTWREADTDHVAPLVKQLYAREFKGKLLKQNTVRKHLNYLKGFIRSAKENKIVNASFIHEHSEVPKQDFSYRAEWLQPWEMGHLINVSFAGREHYPHNACQAWPEILSTEAYTGARESEVKGLKVSDVSLTGGTRGCGTIKFADNEFRRLKNEESERLFSLWPQHAEIIQTYLGRNKNKLPHDGLLFPNPKGRMWGELQGSMVRDLLAAKITKKITDHSMRHSYISARTRMYTRYVQGSKIVEKTTHLADIIAEVGHGSDKMAREVYTHDSPHPVEGWTELDYAAALRLHRKNGLVALPPVTAAKRPARSAASSSSTVGTVVTVPAKRRRRAI